MREKNITRVTREQALKMKGETDWERLRAMTDEDIARAVADEPDTMMLDDEWFATAKWVMPQNKKMVALRLDQDVLDWFRKDGKGYQTRINAVLRAFMMAQNKPTNKSAS